MKIDGRFGEGGGQIVRSSLALSGCTGVPIELSNIRGGRKKSGLLRQHLTAVRAAAEICGATVSGDELGSHDIVFEPGEVHPGSYRFDIGSAGSANLVLQTVLPMLMHTYGESEVVIEGGTHNRNAPTSVGLRDSFVPHLAGRGADVELDLEVWGFEPVGRGRIRVRVRPNGRQEPLCLANRGKVRFTAHVAGARVRSSVARRELAVLQERLELDSVEVLEVPSEGPGNVVWVSAHMDGFTETFTGFGRRGASAEKVAHEVVREVEAWMATGALVGEYTADQWVLPMALAGGGSFTTVEPSSHLRTQMALIPRFLPVSFDATPEGRAWRMTLAERRNPVGS